MNDNHSRLGHRHLAEAAKEQQQRQSLDSLRTEVQPHLPDFELGECIGRGGMGAVFRARQRNLDRAVAVKVLLPPPGEVEGWAERFRREAQALARLQHPGIVTVHDYGQSGELAWLVMELVEGTNLRTLLDEGHLQASEALAIVPPVCEALQYAHDRGIVHRDIKPENVLLDLDGRVKLVDFGLAKLTVGDPHNLTRSDQAMGTPRYMAPEQLEKPLEVDHRADIFSLGVVLYEMLTGQVPAGVVEPPSRKVGSDVRLDEVVMRALQREPAQRYQSAADLETGVQQLGSHRPRRAPEPPLPAADAPTVNGWTLADLLALLVLPTALFLVAATQQRYTSASDVSRLWSMLIPWIFAATFWLTLPCLTTVHSLMGRRRPVALAMPMVRATIAVLGTALMLAVYAANHEGTGWSSGMTGDTWATTTTLRLVLLPMMAIAAVAGAWSQRGCHRVLFSGPTARMLVTAAAALATIPTFVGLVASLSTAIDYGSISAIHSRSLPVMAQVPSLLGCLVAVHLHKNGYGRAAILAATIGIVLTTVVHTLANLTYGDWTLAAYGGLFVSSVLCLVTLAGTAAPMPRKRA